MTMFAYLTFGFLILLFFAVKRPVETSAMLVDILGGDFRIPLPNTVLVAIGGFIFWLLWLPITSILGVVLFYITCQSYPVGVTIYPPENCEDGDCNEPCGKCA